MDGDKFIKEERFLSGKLYELSSQRIKEDLEYAIEFYKSNKNIKDSDIKKRMIFNFRSDENVTNEMTKIKFDTVKKLLEEAKEKIKENNINIGEL